MKCPSCTAAKVATAAATAIGTGVSKNSAMGTATKSSSPVALLARVCGNTHFLYIAKAEIWFIAFTTTIAPAQIHSQLGKEGTGNSLTQQQATKAKSATLSSNAPALLSQWSLRARKPSSMSLAPHTR